GDLELAEAGEHGGASRQRPGVDHREQTGVGDVAAHLHHLALVYWVRVVVTGHQLAAGDPTLLVDPGDNRVEVGLRLRGRFDVEQLVGGRADDLGQDDGNPDLLVGDALGAPGRGHASLPGGRCARGTAGPGCPARPGGPADRSGARGNRPAGGAAGPGGRRGAATWAATWRR